MLQVIKRKRIWPRVLVAAAVVAGGLWWWHHHREAASGEADGKGSAPWSLWPSQMPNAAPTLGTAPTPGAMPPENVRPVPSPLDTMEEPVFRADSKGDLILDTQTKNDLERVYALYQGDEAQRKLTQFSSRIPEKARRQLRDLFQKYGQYAQALAQAVPPAQDDVSLEEANKQLEAIDGLQKAYFGDDADRLFGPEMKQKKDMVHDMTDMSTQHPGMSVQDLAGLAQQHQNAPADPKPSGQQPHSAGNGGLGNGVGAGGAPAKQGPSKGPGG
jgi:hypothetical protein